MENLTLINKDCLEALVDLPDKSISLVFSDPPYGTTMNKWDNLIPFEDYIIINNKNLTKDDYLYYAYKSGVDYALAIHKWNEEHINGVWSHLERIIKDNGVIALWAQSPFDKILAMSNPNLYRYEWIIEKTKGTGHLNAKKMPMKCHENILIFYKKTPLYNPQMTEGHAPVHGYTKHTTDGSNYGKTKEGISGGGSTQRYPRDVLKYKWDTQTSSLHPTQKPLEPCKYIINTYTNEGDTVLDFCMGSGTTGVACKELNRDFIGIEKDKSYFDVACIRLS